MGSEILSLSEFVTHQKGFAFKSKDYVEQGVPVVRVSNFTEDNIDLSDLKYVTEEVAQANSAVELKFNDVIIATVGSWPKNPASVVGKTVRVPEEADGSLLNQNAVRLRVTSNLESDQRFLYYLLKTNNFKSYIVSTAQGSANQASITLKDIYNYSFNKLSKQERRFCVEVLGTLDDKIELNKKINQTLEQMAQALFKSWFVDFDPVFDNLLDKHGNNLEKAKAYLKSKGAEDLCPKLSKRYEQRQQIKDQKSLPQDIRNLFPSDFRHNQDLGWIPEGWEASSLGEHFNIVMGQSPKGDTYNEDGDGMVFFQGRRDFGFRYPTPRVYTTDPKRIANKGDTLISVRAPVGDRNLAATECCLGRGVASLKHKSGSTSFTYYLVGIIESKLADRGADGTVFSSINKKELAGFPFIAPNEETISSFDSLVRSFDNKVEVNSSQVNELEEIRNTLLPKLISGELRLESHDKAQGD